MHTQNFQSKSAKNEIIVTVFCAVFNHEKYLRSALESFVMQETNFNFEVIIHDDASTDQSKKIIQEYADRYPNIIKPIYQEENQYSKGVLITTEVMLPNAKGKYFAWCEGDDYWTDKHKLQKQVNALRKNPDCLLCSHIVTIKKDDKPTGKFPTDYKAGVCTSLDALEMGYLHTSSLLIDADAYKSYALFAKNNPEIWGSEAYQMYMKLTGKVFFIDEKMSVYRYLTAGSWTDSQSKHVEKQIENRLRFLKMLYTFNDYSNKNYNTYFKKRINSDVLSYLALKDNKKRILSKEYDNIIKMLSVKNKIKLWLWAHFENFYYRLLHI